jgi:hypothetical protein
MNEQQTSAERIEALELKVEKRDRIVYRQWRDLKALVNDRYRQKEA